ncbi:MAG: glycosyltransferase, partial [Actinobacteria bacterium]|nr:glycosyltransferase [Actinomycetota bacterium]
MATPFVDSGWRWPEPRLLDSNAALSEALLIAGDALRDEAALKQGLGMLGFLLRVEIRDRHLSVTPRGGRGPEDSSPGFDQQPVQVATIADACATAYRVTADPRWLTGINLAWRWFLGDNDARMPMVDRVTGAGYDDLQVRGRSAGAGAASTLAALSTAQQARR